MNKIISNSTFNVIKEEKETSYDFSISYKAKNTKAFSMPKIHYHSIYEIHYLLSGERTLLLNNRLQNFNKGDLLFIKSNDMHRMMSRNKTNHQRYMLEFRPDYLVKIAAAEMCIDLVALLDIPSQVISLDSEDQKEILGIMESIHGLGVALSDRVDEIERMDIITNLSIIGESSVESYQKIIVKFRLLELLIAINRIKRKEANVSGLVVKSSKELQGQLLSHHTRITREVEARNTLHNKIPTIIEYIHEHYNKSLTVDELCEVFFISKSYFCHIFKEMTGLSFISYLNEVRIREAKVLIGSGHLLMTEVALATGFNSGTHFGRVFKGITGSSPMAYKKSL